MYVSDICAEGIFVTLPWWLKNVKSRSKIVPFSNERHFEIWFPKKKTTITFFWSKLSKLHKKDPILHVETTFSLKQGETRTSHGPISHPLSQFSVQKIHLVVTIQKRYSLTYLWSTEFQRLHFRSNKGQIGNHSCNLLKMASKRSSCRYN